MYRYLYKGKLWRIKVGKYVVDRNLILNLFDGLDSVL